MHPGDMHLTALNGDFDDRGTSSPRSDDHIFDDNGDYID